MVTAAAPSSLELIKYNAHSGKFELGQAALQALRSVKGPVGVVAVCGRARQGKSFILNQLLQTSGGFQVGPTHRPCTKGLWMWSAPIRQRAPDGSEHHLVLLDTEGIDAYDQTSQYSTQIFSLAVLLSSLFVYNQMGGIDESALDRLSLVTEMTKHIRVRAGGQDRLGDHSPAFLWLLRDFYLQLEEEGRKITAQDYLETALMPVPGAGPSVEAKNQIRSSIKALFPNRDCFTLVRPMHDEAALRDLDKIPRDQLRPEFKQGVAQLISIIFSRGQPKRFGAQPVTGPLLAGLVEAYVGAINAGAVPTIATAWQGVAEAECRRAGDAAEARYVEEFRADVAREEAALDAEHARCLQVARAAFDDVAVGDETIRCAHEAKFVAAVTSRFKDIRARRLAEAASQVNELLYTANVKISQALAAGADLPALTAQMGSFIEQYAAAAAGPTKWERLSRFLGDAWPGVVGQLMAKAEAQAAKALDAVKQQLEQSKQALAAAQSRAAAAEAGQAASASRLEAAGGQLAAAQTELAGLKAALDAKSAKVAALEAQIKDLLTTSERHQANAATMADARVRAAEADFHQKLAEATAALSSERLRVSGLTADLQAAQARAAALEGQAASLSKAGDEWMRKHSKEMSEKLSIMSERDEARAAMAMFQAERDALQRRLDAELAQAAALRAALADKDDEAAGLAAVLDQHMQEAQHAVAQEQQARTAARGSGSAAAGARRSNDENALGQGHSNIQQQQQAGASAGAGAAGGVLLDSDTLNGMTIADMKDWLTQRDQVEAVWAMNARKPAAKRADWQALIQRVAAGGGGGGAP